MRRLGLMLAALAVALAGCGVYYPYYYGYVYYAPYYYSYDGYVAYTWIDPSQAGSGQVSAQQGIDLNGAATSIAEQAGSYYTPAGCATATASGATVNYTFNHCNGQFGVESVSGTATLTLSESNGQLLLHGQSDNLTVNGRAFILDLTATAAQTGDRRSVSFTSSSRYPDESTARHSEGTLAWQQGSDCLEASGSGTASDGDRDASATVTDFQRCKDACPTAGTVTVESPDGAFTGSFNGSSTLVVKAPNGALKTYDLHCSG